MKNIFYLIKLIPNHRRRVVEAVTVSTVLGFLGVAAPYLLKLIIDSITAAVSGRHSDSSQEIIFLLAIFASISIVTAIGNYFQEKVSDLFWLDTLVGLRQQLYMKVTDLSIAYYEQTRTGELIQKTSNGIQEVSRWLFGMCQQFLSIILGAIFTLGYVIIAMPAAGLILIIFIPLAMFNSIQKARQTRPMYKNSHRKAEEASGVITEAIANISTIRSLSANKYVENLYHEKISDFKTFRASIFRVEWNSNFVRSVLNYSAVILSLAVVALGALKGQYTTGDIMLVSILSQRLIGYVQQIGRLIVDTTIVETSAERVVDVFNNENVTIDKSTATVLNSIESIEFRNVSFAYPGKKTKVLDGVSFNIEPGQTFALVGKSGVGKSTLTKLLLRFYEPTEGEILINDEPIQNFTQESVRRHIGVVMQDVALFNDTIGSNLELANPKATKAQVKNAAIKAHANVFIEKLPEGYKTLVGERGVKLSGGEKQRVAIARAILKDPQLIILDEATSALDSESERHVQAGLMELMTGRTAIVIAHRLSTVMRADQILVIGQGKIIEQGTHSELVAKKNGTYAKLFKLQSGALQAA